jgi:ABC-type dipeptide/oligopeptide/nickel transport system permease component
VLRFLGKRLALSVFTMLLFATFVFFLASLLMPGDFTNNFMPGADRGALRGQLGLDRPLIAQWARFMGSLLTLDLGDSLTGLPIADSMAALLPWTLLVFTVAVGVAFVVGITFGRIAGWSRRRWLQGGIRFTSVTTHSLFPPFLTFFLVWGFVQIFGLEVWSDVQGLEVTQHTAVRIPRLGGIAVPDYGALPWLMIGVFAAAAAALVGLAWVVRRLTRRRLPAMASLAVYLGAVWVGWGWLGVRDQAVDVMMWMSFGMLAVAILAFGEIVLVIDASMVGARSEDYVMTARAKGLRDVDIRNRHAARLALLPAMSKFVVSLPFVLSGLVIVEYAFTVPSHYNASLYYPGISRALFGALTARDFPLVVGGLLVIGVLSVTARLAIDLIHARMDPRLLVTGETPVLEP